MTAASIPPSDRRAKALGQLRETINQTIGSVFFAPLLKGMRESPLKGKFGHGGRGEEAFGAQLDQILVERAGAATNFNLSGSLFKRLAPAAGAYAERTRA